MTIVCTGLMLLLLTFSDAAMEAALTAAECFVSGVMPALMPMMVLGKLLPCHAPDGRGLRLWLKAGLFACAAGSPAAAQRAVSVQSRLRPRGWECMLCLTGVMSPMFFTGSLAGWLGSARDGWLLLGVHWLGAAVTAGLWALFARPQPTPMAQPAQGARISLPEAIVQSAQSMLCIVGAMMVFSVAASLARSLLTRMFPAWTQAHAAWLAIGWAVLEIGGGSRAVIACCAQPQALLSALCGFGGLSIWLQNLLFVQKSIRPARLLGMRAVHGAVCYALFQAFLKIQNLLIT